jgi:hypothetical protein
MKPILCSRPFLAAMTVASLLGAPACRKSGPDQVVRQMAEKDLQLDRLGQQAGNAGLPPVRPKVQLDPSVDDGLQEIELK